MKIARRAGLMMVVFVLSGTPGAGAQMGMGGRTPQIQGVWNPVVGSGAVYQVESKDTHKTEMEIAVVGSETVDNKPGYWLEMSINDPRGGGPMYIKHLIVLDSKQTIVTRMIMQAPGQPPLEMSIEMMSRGGRSVKQPADVRDRAERVGSETITTPAGTFTCEHWRIKDGSADVWYSEKVAPYGLVKMTGRDSTMTLLRVITDAKTHITGTPEKFDPVEMMRRKAGRP